MSYLNRYDTMLKIRKDIQASPLAGRDAIMKNKAYTRQLSPLLCPHDIWSNIELVSRTDSIVRYDEADLFLIIFIC